MTLSFSRLNQWLSRVLNWGVGGGFGYPKPPSRYSENFPSDDQRLIQQKLSDPVPTVRVRIAVAINSKGRWHSTGDSDSVSTDKLNGETALRWRWFMFLALSLSTLPPAYWIYTSGVSPWWFAIPVAMLAFAVIRAVTANDNDHEANLTFSEPAWNREQKSDMSLFWQ